MRALARILLAAALLGGCGTAFSPSPPRIIVPTPVGPPASVTGAITVFAGISLRDALTAAKAAYEAANPGVSITLSFDAPDALRARIEQGAPADLFASSDIAGAQAVVTDQLAAGPATPIANSDIVLVVAKGDPANINSPADLARQGVKVAVAGEGDPITAYANQVLARLATLPGYPADYAAAVSANTISRESDVRAVLAKVAQGAADAGFVYSTDVAGSTAVQIIAIPVPARVTAHYAAVPIARTANLPATTEFLRWLTGRDGQVVLARFGFRPPGKE